MGADDMDECMGPDQGPNERKPYDKPQIQEVPLRPDEAVLGGCKTSSSAGPAQARCTAPRSCSSTLS